MVFDLVQLAEVAGGAVFGGVVIIASRKYEDKAVHAKLNGHSQFIRDSDKRIDEVEKDLESLAHSIENDKVVRRMQIDAAVKERTEELEKMLAESLSRIHRLQMTILELLVDVARKGGVESRVTDALVK